MKTNLLFNRFSFITMLSVAGVLAGGLAVARAQTTEAQPAQAEQPSQTAKAPDSLQIYFAEGSSAIAPQEKAVLDEASRIYNDGKPIVMIVTGSSDTVGQPVGNLLLSQRRANAVLNALVARGIPAVRFQVLATGVTALPVPTPPDVANPKNRRVEISWR